MASGLKTNSINALVMVLRIRKKGTGETQRNEKKTTAERKLLVSLTIDEINARVIILKRREGGREKQRKKFRAWICKYSLRIQTRTCCMLHYC